MLTNQTFLKKEYILLDLSFFCRKGKVVFFMYRALAFRNAAHLHEFFDFILLLPEKLSEEESNVVDSLDKMSLPLLGKEVIDSKQHYDFFRNRSFGYFCPLFDKIYGRLSKSFFSSDPDIFLSCLMREFEVPLSPLDWNSVNRDV